MALSGRAARPHSLVLERGSTGTFATMLQVLVVLVLRSGSAWQAKRAQQGSGLGCDPALAGWLAGWLLCRAGQGGPAVSAQPH